MSIDALERALRKCDRDAKNYSGLCESVDLHLRPIIDKLLNQPLNKAVNDYTSVDECSPTVASVREYLTKNGEDDVWLFMYRICNHLLENSVRKRSRGADASQNLQVRVTNVFTLFCNRSIPPLDKLNIRWRFLIQERKLFEASDNYAHANASERRRFQTQTVLFIFSERAHRHIFSSLWLKCIDFAADVSLHAHVLHKLGPTVLPSLTNPLVVADYLSESFRSGGLISVLSLQGLFVLMIDHGLEYPQFYDQLYSLITPDAFASRHRYDLFKLLDLSMGSLRVPSYIAASVIKRTVQVCLLSPSPVLYFGLPFVRKVLQVHPNCLALVHRRMNEATAPPCVSPSADVCAQSDVSPCTISTQDADLLVSQLFNGIDPYLSDQCPASSCALYSTLWEFTALERHFLPTVPLMINAFSSTAEDKAALKYEKSFGRLFTAEITREILPGHVPSLAYRAPEEFFQEDLIKL